jgi:tRNA(Ile)-lysidine synthase
MAVAKRYVVAVSGGVDSVVLLDMMRRLPDVHLVVAHFDHGIRLDSAQDAAFVGELAKQHSLPFETAREELGKLASEETARQRRYAFLKAVAEKHNAKIVTAHHSDDLVETIAINHLRGTGWRGLTPMSGDVLRPLLALDKATIKNYAATHGLVWREDVTNKSDAYLRNRVRCKLSVVPADQKQALLALHKRQQQLKKEIEKEVKQLVGDDHQLSRYFFTHAHEKPVLELLRHVTKGKLTHPQLKRALLAIKTAKPRATYQAGAGVEFHFTPRYFSVELLK